MTNPMSDSIIDSILTTWRRMFANVTNGAPCPREICGRQHVFEDLIVKRLVELGVDRRAATALAINATCDVMSKEMGWTK